ncbi:MAG: DUF4417 domain-containing protein [Verrucomicrobiota bacterium]
MDTILAERQFGYAGCPSFDHDQCGERKWTCACNPSLLGKRMLEVGGFGCKLEATLKSIEDTLPKYVTTIYHSGGRSGLLDLDWVAIPLYRIIHYGSDGIPNLIADDAQSLRNIFRLHSRTKIIVTGPGADQGIENFWKHHQKAGLLTRIQKLRISIFTVPNYSFFFGMPPMHHRYNRSRILRMGERASAAGLPTILHANILHEADWCDWENLIREHPEITALCFEFQTGFASAAVGERVFDRLVKLQSNVNRPIHPILIGGARYAARLGKHFTSATVIDAQPFMQTAHRKSFDYTDDDRSQWVFNATPLNEAPDARFKGSLQKYSRRIGERMDGVPPIRQTELPFRIPSSKGLSGGCRQMPVRTLPLFDQSQALPERAPDSGLQGRYALPTRRPADSQTASSAAQAPTREKLATSRPSSRHKKSFRILQPNGSAPVKKADEVVDHLPATEAEPIRS